MAAVKDFSDNKTIFVSDIAPTVGDSELYKLVSELVEDKEVLTVHINRDPTRYETAIAYINMNSHEAAKKVISKMNGKLIKDRKINMSWSIKDYHMRTENTTNLYIKNIKRDITQQQLQDIFNQYGETLSVKLSTNEKNQSNGFGYVKYVEIETSEKVLSLFDEIKSKIGEETFILTKYEKQPRANKTNLFIGNVDKNITEEQFIKYFETFGPISVDATTGKKTISYGYVSSYDKCRGYVNFKNSEDAEKALTSPKMNVLGEGELKIAYYKKKGEIKKEWKLIEQEKKTNCSNKYKDFNLYIKTGQVVITEEELRKELSPCGNIYSLKVKYYGKEPTGTAYVCFEDKESTQRAMDKCKSLNWECNVLVTKNERMAQNHYQMPSSYMYPMNYFFQYMQLFPQYFPQFFMSNKQMTGGRPMNQPKPNKPNKPQKQPKPQKPREEPKPKVEKEIITDDMKNDLGDKLFDHILEKGYDEDLTGRITGVLLESLDYIELKKKMEDSKEELDKIIEEVKVTLEKMDQAEN